MIQQHLKIVKETIKSKNLIVPVIIKWKLTTFDIYIFPIIFLIFQLL
jgi:hypothetical protein